MIDLGLGFVIPSGAAEQELIHALREHNPMRAQMSATELLRAVTREEVFAALAEVNHLPFLPGLTRQADAELLLQFDHLAIRRAQMIPIQLTSHRVQVAIANPYNTAARDYLGQHFAEHEHVFLLVTATEIEAALETLANKATVSREAIDQMELMEAREDVKDFVLGEKYSEVVPEVMRGVFLDAVQRQASDIHIITGAETFYYTLRVNGDLQRPTSIDNRLIPRVDAWLLSLVNIEREMSISQIGLSGRFALVLTSGRRIDCRYERHRTFRGYHVTIRLLDKSRVEPRLGVGGLAFEDRSSQIEAIAKEADVQATGDSETQLHFPVLTHLRRAMELSDGIVIISGPTGSGKSTTLTAMLREVAKPRYCVLTLENPVEYEIPGVVHCNMADNAEFGSYIRSFMRSDPDIILMGEVRDKASADLAVEAAMTGHQVFTTVHTNSAAEILSRFTQLGVERADIARTVRLMCGQRLVKTLCRHCCTKAPLSAEQAALYSIPQQFVGRMVGVPRDGGCGECGGTGISGRKALLEVLPIDRVIGALIVSGASAYEVEAAIRRRYKVSSLKEQGLELLLSGSADLEAVKDVVNLSY
jgi:type II secretory ATPase GspE/PulE/Tfp pilus assembly ATPase PilB-like protein